MGLPRPQQKNNAYGLIRDAGASFEATPLKRKTLVTTIGKQVDDRVRMVAEAGAPLAEEFCKDSRPVLLDRPKRTPEGIQFRAFDIALDELHLIVALLQDCVKRGNRTLSCHVPGFRMLELGTCCRAGVGRIDVKREDTR